MIRWIAVALWVALAVFGIVTLRPRDEAWKWVGAKALPPNYRLTGADWPEIETGPDRKRYEGRYVRRRIEAGGYFTQKDLAAAPEIEIPKDSVPVIVPLAQQSGVASSLNASRAVSMWSNGAQLIDGATISAIVCPKADADAAACNAVIALKSDEAAKLADADMTKLLLLPVRAREEK